MLVAPAGYGKTTLARQWLASQVHAWYQAKPASADVAKLAVTLAECCAQFTPNAAVRLGERLLATQDASNEIPALAQIQADALAEWPKNAWLALDDYQFIAKSEDAEAYVDELLNSAPVRILLTSRLRPRWATSRHLLYGQFYELGRTALEMDDDEARSVLMARSRATNAGFLELANGWPAVIGLGALTEADRPKTRLPEMLYDFLADELYQAASVPLREALRIFALCPSLTSELLHFLFGPRQGAELHAEAEQLGFLTSAAPHEGNLHPLLREFLLRKLREDDSSETARAVRRIANFLLENDRWDDVFDLFRRYHLDDVLVDLVDRANEDMLRTGRLRTLSEWLAAARELRLGTPLLDVVEAEVALRHGHLVRAETLSVNLASRDDPAKSVRSRALAVAGQAAYLDNRESDALTHYRRARKLAPDRDSRRRASWGKLRCLNAYERDEDVQKALADFLQEDPVDTDELLQSANARVMVAITTGGLPEALEGALRVKGVWREAQDPLIRTAYLNILARSFTLLAQYANAVDSANEMIDDARRTRLTFVLPYAYVAKALAELGLHRFGPAHASIDEAQQASEAIGDVHNLIEVQMLRCKLAIATGDFQRAIDITADNRWSSRVTVEMRAEYTANRALALACSTRTADALDTAAEAVALTALPEVVALVGCVHAVAAINRDGEDTDVRTIDHALESVFRYSVFDPFVVAYRGCPALLRMAASSIPRRDAITSIVRQASDAQLANSIGFRVMVGPSESVLSRREEEVLDLLGLGYTNREIAAALYIAEGTAKTHVQHVLHKLGVRSRTEAALVALRTRGRSSRVDGTSAD
jgi:DNA-binding NarL/FixJ family response regulator